MNILNAWSLYMVAKDMKIEGPGSIFRDLRPKPLDKRRVQTSFSWYYSSRNKFFTPEGVMTEFTALITTFELVSGVASLLAFLSLVGLAAYRYRLRYDRQVLQSSDANPEVIRTVLNRYNLRNIPPERQHDVAITEIENRFTITKYLIVAGTIIILAAFGALVSSPSPGNAKTCGNALNSAQSSSQKGNYPSAIQQLEEALPRCDDIKLKYSMIRMLGELNGVQGKFVKALSWYEKGSELIENNKTLFTSLEKGDAYHDLGIAEENLERVTASRSYFKTALEEYDVSDASTQAKVSLARVLLYQSGDAPSESDVTDALIYLNSVVTDGSGGLSPVPHMLLACAHSIQVETEKAKSYIKEVARLYLKEKRVKDAFPDMLSYFFIESGWESRPTYPYPCPAFIELINTCNCYSELAAMFRPPPLRD